MFKPEFLADDVRVTADEDELVARIAARVNEGLVTARQVFGTANVLALALVRLGERAASEQLCRAEIAAAVRASGINPQVTMLHALEAQVNLYRIAARHHELAPALAGFALLEGVCDGRPVTFAELHWDPARLPGPTELRRARVYARNVLVIDSCRLLLAERQSESLVDRARHFIGRWPKIVRDGLHAPAEVGPLLGVRDPGLVPPPDDKPPSAGSRRLSLITALHAARNGAVTGAPYQKCEVEELEAAVGSAAGPFLCEGTPLRWQFHLAATRVLMGDVDGVLATMRVIAVRASAIKDRALFRQVIAVLGPEEEDRRPDRSDLAAAAHDLVPAVSDALHQLASVPSR